MKNKLDLILGVSTIVAAATLDHFVGFPTGMIVGVVGAFATYYVHTKQ